MVLSKIANVKCIPYTRPTIGERKVDFVHFFLFFRFFCFEHSKQKILAWKFINFPLVTHSKNHRKKKRKTHQHTKCKSKFQREKKRESERMKQQIKWHTSKKFDSLCVRVWVCNKCLVFDLCIFYVLKFLSFLFNEFFMYFYAFLVTLFCSTTSKNNKTDSFKN